jgi:transcriptional regulator with XRE-family HTH domain
MRSKNVPLLAAMATAGLTGKELAQRAGLSRVSVSLILNGRVCPKPESTRRIAKALGVPVHSIFPDVSAPASNHRCETHQPNKAN